jgi:hypothetical protein
MSSQNIKTRAQKGTLEGTRKWIKQWKAESDRVLGSAMLRDKSIYIDFIRIQELIDEYISLQKDTRDHFDSRSINDYILKMSTLVEKDDRHHENSYENTTDSSSDDA